MNHTMHGIIFSYGKPTGLGDLIAHRIPGSMPFGGNYRVVDFSDHGNRCFHFFY